MADAKANEMSERSISRAHGRALRQDAPRSSHGKWEPAPDRADPLDLLQAQDQGRVQHLLPIKYGRMMASPFAFLRGSAVVMAADLAGTPVSGVNTILCGDAHLSNFGIFATPERNLVFDVNDFDEVYPGPWEWDIKRLAASAVVAARDNGFAENHCREMAVGTVQSYRKAMANLDKMQTLDVWYFHIEAERVMAIFDAVSSKKGKKAAKKMISKAQTKTQEQTLEKLTYIEDGQRRINHDAPLLVPIREMHLEQHLNVSDLRKLARAVITDAWGQYLDSLPDERRYLLRRYHILDVALRVGGVGSVGTRCFIVLLQGPGGLEDALLLQLKEAGHSALQPYLDTEAYEEEAKRVVTGQRLIQANSDIFLGWHSSSHFDRNYYWRQLKDMKGSADVAALDEAGFRTYIGVCAACLARAHARTGDEAAIIGYLGKSDTFPEAIADFAVSYADQTERDYDALVKAVESGRIVAQTGI